MKKLFGLMILIGLLAVACGGGPAGGPGAAATEAPAVEGGEGEIQLAPQLSVYNWADYIDEQVLAEWQEVRASVDPHGLIRSDLSERLGLS